MSTINPVIGMKGLWFVNEPFSVSETTIYECIAIRSMQEYESSGGNLLDDIYAPVGLTQAEVDQDRALGGLLITLRSDTKPQVVIPNTYFSRLPDMDYVLYRRFIVSIDLGYLPTETPFAHLNQQLSETAAGAIGLTPDIKVLTLGEPAAISQTLAEQQEAVREQAIVSRDTPEHRLALANQIIDSQREHITQLNQLLRDLGVVAP